MVEFFKSDWIAVSVLNVGNTFLYSNASYTYLGVVNVW
jgi:hypothetical protein